MHVHLLGVALFALLHLCNSVRSVQAGPPAPYPARQAGEATNGAPTEVATELMVLQRYLAREQPEALGMEAYYRFRKRFERKAETRLTLSLQADFLERELTGEEFWPNDVAARRGRMLLKDSIRYTIREWVAETRFVQWLKEDFTDLIYDAISGREERHNLAAPLESDFAAHEEERWSRGFKKGIRPLRSNPYAYLSYGLRDTGGILRYNSTLRLYLEEWSVPRVTFLNEVPMGRWRLGAGLTFDTASERGREGRTGRVLFRRDGRKFVTSLGLKGPLLGGIVYGGADITSGGFIVQYHRLW